MKRWMLAGLGLLLSGCTAADWEAVSRGLAAGLADAQYQQQYYGYNPYNPTGFRTYSGWPSGYSYGQYVGYYQCRRTGSFYACDSNGDGYIDMYGNLDTGSYSSSNLRVNGRGEAFTWESGCGCWVRNRAYDGPRKTYRDRYDRY